MEAMEDFFIDPGISLEPWQVSSSSSKFASSSSNFASSNSKIASSSSIASSSDVSNRADSPSSVLLLPNSSPPLSSPPADSSPAIQLWEDQCDVQAFDPSVDATVKELEELLLQCDGDRTCGSSQRGKDDLLTMLQRCIATHMTAGNGAAGAASGGRKKKTAHPADKQKQLVAGLQTAMKRRQQQQPVALTALSSLTPRYVAGALSRDVMSLLHDCAYAVAARDVGAASELTAEIRRRHAASPRASDPRLRLAFFFSEALVARALGTGAELSAQRGGPLGDEVAEKVYAFRIRHTPSPLLPHFFSTQAVLRSLGRRRSLHVIDIGMARNRFQWSLLLSALGLRAAGGPPALLRVAALDAPAHRRQVERAGRMIVTRGAQLGIGRVEFESALFNPVDWETGLSRLRRHDSDVLVVNALFALDWLEDEPAVWARSRRRAVLEAVARLRPDAVVLGVNDGRLAAAAETGFLDRFSQAVRRFSAKFDYAADVCAAAGDEGGRAEYEGRFLAPEILNLIACDGRQRVVRTAPYEEWDRDMVSAGFKLDAVDPLTFQRMQSMMGAYNPHFGAELDGGWLKLSWKKVTTQCVSCWSRQT